MALVTEDGTGLSTAESYSSVAEADAYHLINGNPTPWGTADDTADKEPALREATQAVDAWFHHRWRGLRTHSVQALAWPRKGVVDDDGFGLLNSDIPVRLKEAVSYLALQVVNGDVLIDQEPDGAGIESESVKIGSIAVATSYQGSNPPWTQYPKVKKLLAHYIQRSGQVQRG